MLRPTHRIEEQAVAEAITKGPDGLNVPDEPIIPFIEGDGTGPDIWAASQRVFDAAVEKAYGGDRRIAWKEVLAGEKANNETGDWLPEETVDAFRAYLVGIKGPLTTPIGEGFRSLNVTLRQVLDLYVCLRPVRWYTGVPSPVKHPEKVDMVIFRENTEDVYAGKELEEGTPEAKRLLEFARDEDYDEIDQGDVLRVENLRDQIATGEHVVVENTTKKRQIATNCSLSDRQRELLLAGGVINWLKTRLVRA